MKQPIFQPLLWFLLILFAAGRCFAERSSDNIQEHIVTFTPDIHIGVNYQPCLGIRLSAEILLTSIECALEIKTQLSNGVSVEASNNGGMLVGHVRQLSRMEDEKGFLDLNSHGVSFKAPQPYPSFHKKPLSGLKYAQGFHVPVTEAVPQAISLTIVHHKSDDYHHYLLKTPVSLPPGAPVSHQGKVVCTVASEGTCRTPVIDERVLGRVQESCSECLSEEQQMYNNCSQICQSGVSYQACKACSQAVQEKEKQCQQICGGLYDLTARPQSINKPDFGLYARAESSISCGGSMQGDLCNNDCAPHLMCSGFWQTAAQCMASQCDGEKNCVILGEDAASCNGLCQLRYRNGHIERGSYCH